MTRRPAREPAGGVTGPAEGSSSVGGVAGGGVVSPDPAAPVGRTATAGASAPDPTGPQLAQVSAPSGMADWHFGQVAISGPWSSDGSSRRGVTRGGAQDGAERGRR